MAASVYAVMFRLGSKAGSSGSTRPFLNQIQNLKQRIQNQNLNLNLNLRIQNQN